MTDSIKNQIRDLWQILIFQLISIPAVVLYFKFIEPKKEAAIYAGVTFLLFGIFSYFKILNWPKFGKELLFWLINIHLFLISIPIFVSRLIFWNLDFENIRIFFIPAPYFHSASEKLYTLILAVVVVKLWRIKKSSSL